MWLLKLFAVIIVQGGPLKGAPSRLMMGNF